MSTIDLLWQLHNNPGEQIPALMDIDIEFDEGQQLQMQLLDRWLNNGEELGGWKIGMTSGASRNAMGPGVRPFGFILKSRIIESGATLALANLHTGQVENELCFRMGQSLGANTTATTAFQAVDSVIPGFEINQKRLPPGAAPGLRVADNLSQWGIVAGNGSTPKQDLDDMCVTLFDLPGTDQQTLSQSDPNQPHPGQIESVPSEGHIDNHYDSLAILANRLAKFGLELAAGHYVITGAYGKTAFAKGSYRGEFSAGVGQVDITLA